MSPTQKSLKLCAEHGEFEDLEIDPAKGLAIRVLCLEGHISKVAC